MMAIQSRLTAVPGTVSLGATPPTFKVGWSHRKDATTDVKFPKFVCVVMDTLVIFRRSSKFAPMVPMGQFLG